VQNETLLLKINFLLEIVRQTDFNDYRLRICLEIGKAKKREGLIGLNGHFINKIG
jgi:hypothetical protein